MKKWFNEKNITLYAAGTGLAVLMIFGLVFRPHYDSKIDILMQSLLYGVGNGSFGARLVYMNTAIGLLLKACVTLLPSLPWYTLMLWALSYLAITVSGWALLRIHDSGLTRIVVFIFTLFAGYQCYIELGHTKTAVALVLAAGALLFAMLRTDGNRILLGILAAFCGILASMLSLWMAIIAGGVLLAMAVVWIPGQKLPLQRLAAAGLALALILAGATVASKVNDKFYTSDSDWSAYYSYAASIEKMYEYGFPDFETEVEDRYGINEFQYAALLNDSFFSNGTEKLDLIQSLGQIREAFGLQSIRSFLQSLPVKALHKQTFYLLAILMALLVVGRNRKKARAIGSALGISCLAYYILYLLNMWQMGLVQFAVFAPAALVLIMYLEDDTLEIKKVLLYLAMFSVILYSRFYTSFAGEQWSDASQVFADMDDTTTYVIDYDTYMQRFSAFERYPTGIMQHENLYFVNGIYQGLPGFRTAPDGLTETTPTVWLDNAAGLEVGSMTIQPTL